MIYEACGTIPESQKENVLLLLKDFFKQAVEKEVAIKEMTCSRATLWLCQEEYKKRLKDPEVEEQFSSVFDPHYGPRIIRPSDTYAEQVPS